MVKISISVVSFFFFFFFIFFCCNFNFAIRSYSLCAFIYNRWLFTKITKTSVDFSLACILFVCIAWRLAYKINTCTAQVANGRQINQNSLLAGQFSNKSCNSDCNRIRDENECVCIFSRIFSFYRFGRCKKDWKSIFFFNCIFFVVVAFVRYGIEFSAVFISILYNMWKVVMMQHRPLND